MAIRWDKFTVKAQEAIQRANELASEHGNPELAPLHLLGGVDRRQRGHSYAGAGENRHWAAGCAQRPLQRN
jgi:ATP-dependent Clp protease ATP-binding subunit ClpA